MRPLPQLSLAVLSAEEKAQIATTIEIMATHNLTYKAGSGAAFSLGKSPPQHKENILSLDPYSLPSIAFYFSSLLSHVVPRQAAGCALPVQRSPLAAWSAA